MKYILISILSMAFKACDFVLWAYVILSWIGRSNEGLWNLYCKLARIIEPLLTPIRKLLQPLTYKIGLDFSPMVLAIVFSWLYNIVLNIIYRL